MRHVDLVVTDHLMGRAMGTEMVAALKRLRPHVPIIILSGSSSPPEGTENADAYVCKSEGPDVLLNRVSALLASAASQREHAEIRTDQLTALSRERLASIVESVMEAIITVDRTQRIVLFNKAAETIFRCPSEQALGKSLDAFIPERFRASHREHIHKFGHTGVTRRSKSFPSVLVGLRADGEEFPIEATISQAGGDGEKFFTVVLRDLTERRQAEEEQAQLAALQHENVALREEIDNASMFEEMVGTSPALQTVLSRVSKVARTDSTVLVTGETGTGKELVAHAIHRRSQRSSRAFVSVNCATIPRDLIASELFGHEKGAFTGAIQRRLGRFELAEGGTIFFDEIGELPAETQIALLRVLQEHRFERVGGTRSIQTDVRVIAATNRDLQAAIAAGTFRSDLFYRLNVFPIEIPPLRERREDIPLLVEYFIDRYARKAGKSIRRVNKKIVHLLQSYPWPGNIRELQNVIERSVIVCESEDFSLDESWLSRQPLATEPKSQLSQKLAAQEKEMIEAALSESGGRVFGPSGAAAKLGMPRSTLESKIRSLTINKNRFKTADPPKNN
jgi:PAS domain S-box-containing protein